MEQDKDNIKIALPENNDVTMEDLETKTINTKEDELAVGMGVIGEASSMKMFSPKDLEPSGNIEIDGKDEGFLFIKKNNASRVKTMMGLDKSRKLTLYHSGYKIGISLLSPNFKNVLQLAVATSQADVSMETLGLAYNNESSMIVKQLIETLESEVEVSTLKSNNPLSNALITDLQSIALLAIGEEFTAVQVCTECSNVHEYEVNWMNTLHVDKSKIDLTLLSKPKHYPKDVKRYQDYIYKNDKEIINTKFQDKDVEITLHIPTIKYYIDYGESWLAKVTDSVDKAISTVSPASRRAILTTSFNLNFVQQYGHFFKSIKIDGDIITNMEDIMETISILWDNGDNEDILEHIREYIRDNTVSVVGVPSYRCLKCDTVMENKEEDSQAYKEHVVSINIVKAFLVQTNLNLMKMVNS